MEGRPRAKDRRSDPADPTLMGVTHSSTPTMLWSKRQHSGWEIIQGRLERPVEVTLSR